MKREKSPQARCAFCGKIVFATVPGNNCLPWAKAHRANGKPCVGSFLSVRILHTVRKGGVA